MNSPPSFCGIAIGSRIKGGFFEGLDIRLPVKIRLQGKRFMNQGSTLIPARVLLQLLGSMTRQCTVAGLTIGTEGPQCRLRVSQSLI